MLCCVWVCPRLGEYFTWGLLELGNADRHTHCVHTTIILSHWLISSFPTILTASSSMAPTLSSLAQTPTRAKLPSWVFSPHSSAPSSFLFWQPWAENQGPGGFQSITHQVTRGTHMLVHVFTHNESFHLMRQFVLSTWPVSFILYRRT